MLADVLALSPDVFIGTNVCLISPTDKLKREIMNLFARDAMYILCKEKANT